MPKEQVEIKVNLVDPAAALAALAVPEGKERRIYFAEDLTPGLGSRYPLLDAGVVIRIRVEADGSGNCTLKLRPCRRSQLVGPWSRPDEDHGNDRKGSWEYRIEGDWTGARRTLSASLVTELTATEAAAAVAAAEQGLSPRHLRYFEACGGLPLEPSALTVLGPVAATKWSKLRVGETDDVAAERWQVGGLDFLELSRKVPADEAEQAQTDLEAGVRAAGLVIDPDPRSKTEQVLEVLVPRR